MNQIAVVETLVRSPAVWTTICILLVAWLFKQYVARPKNASFPVAEMQPSGMVETLQKGRSKYPDSPFILPGHTPYVILPHSIMDEVKGQPYEVLSFNKHIGDIMFGAYTGIGPIHHEITSAVKIDLTRNISKVLSDLQDEAVYALDGNIGSCPEWKPVPVFGCALQIVALLSGRTFVGLPLSRDKEWTDATINFTGAIVAVVTALHKRHPLIRQIVAPFLPEVRNLKAFRKLAAKKLEPQIRKIVEQFKNANNPNFFDTPSDDEETEGSFSMVHWLLKYVKDVDSVDAEKIGHLQLMIAFAAIHTTSMGLSNAIFDLAAHPQYMAELRAEFEGVIADENYPDKRLRKTSLPKLRKLDSFIKESQRMNPPTYLAMLREVTAAKGFTTSTGHTIPCGQVVAFGHSLSPGSAEVCSKIHVSDSQPSLDIFSPFRHSDLRSLPGEDMKHQFVTISPESPSFGIGPTACPGRFFASNEIKVTLIEILKRYDVGLGPAGEGDGQGGFKRPTSFTSGMGLVPDPRAVIFVRDRKV